MYPNASLGRKNVAIAYNLSLSYSYSILESSPVSRTQWEDTNRFKESLQSVASLQALFKTYDMSLAKSDTLFLLYF